MIETVALAAAAEKVMFSSNTTDRDELTLTGQLKKPKGYVTVLLLSKGSNR
jgi:hypothetical protein